MNGRRATTRPVAGAVLGVVAVVAVALPSGCAVEEALPEPSCAAGGTVILAAQSVPTAELVPCFDSLPAGWNVASVTIDQDGTVVGFDSDRAGDGAASFRYESSCEREGAVRAPSEFEQAERYELVERVTPSLRARRFYPFDGGCAWWAFDFDDGAPAALAVELGDRLDLVPRDELNRSIRDTFIDEEV
jgi:hypothetical protein